MRFFPFFFGGVILSFILRLSRKWPPVTFNLRPPFFRPEKPPMGSRSAGRSGACRRCRGRRCSPCRCACRHPPGRLRIVQAASDGPGRCGGWAVSGENMPNLSLKGSQKWVWLSKKGFKGYLNNSASMFKQVVGAFSGPRPSPFSNWTPGLPSTTTPNHQQYGGLSSCGSCVSFFLTGE